MAYFHFLQGKQVQLFAWAELKRIASESPDLTLHFTTVKSPNPALPHLGVLEEQSTRSA